MSANSLSTLFAQRRTDPAIRLLAETMAAMRADAGFVERSDDAAAGALLSDETPAVLASGALDSVMARIEAAGEADARARSSVGQGRWADEIARLPSPLREAALGALKTNRWRFVGFGIRRLPLMTGEGAFAELMRVEPGRGVVDHDHEAEELTLILTGGYHDSHHHYGPGDLSVARPGFVHDPKADPDEVCYLLAVTYGPASFKGLFGLLQKLMGPPAAARSAWSAN
jgi:putative transcriptional regulator